MADTSGLTRHASEFGEWEAVLRPPHPLLAPYVRRMSGWWERTTFSRRREVPHAGTVLIVNIGNRLNVSEPGAPGQLRSFHSFFAGMHSSYVVTESNGLGGGMQIDFTPLGGHLFTGVPASALVNRVVELEDVLGTAGRILTDQLEYTPDWEARFELVESALFARFAAAQPPSEGIAWAWERMERSHGLVSVASLGNQLGWTPRQLIDGFRRELGLPPKQMARILRFQEAVKRLAPEARPCFADIAAECGYYDQAHFAREFREFAGSTPRQYHERMIPESGGVLDEEPGMGKPGENSYKTAASAAG